MIELVFGSVGSGKSCYAQKVVDRCVRKRIPVFANCEFGGASLFYIKDLGKKSFPRGSVIVIDEAGIEFNNRKFKSFPPQLIEYLKMHRHYGIKKIIFISQDFEDCDVTIRRLATSLIHCRKIGFWGLYRPVFKFVTVNKESGQLEYGYRFGSVFGWRVLLLPVYWSKYNSYCDDVRPLVESVKVDVPKRDFRNKVLIVSCWGAVLAVLFMLLGLFI